MEKNSVVKTSKNPVTIAIIAIIIALVMVVSYIVSLRKFGDSEDGTSSLASSTAGSTEQSDLPVESEPVENYKYYNQLKLGNRAFTNDKVLTGSLAVIKPGDDSFPAVNESKLANIASSMTPEVYGLSNFSLVVDKVAIKNIDNLLVSFYDRVPSNGLIIHKGYASSDEIDVNTSAVDLVTGYSVQFSIYNSPYRFSDQEFNFLREQAHQYGVIQRYPVGKEAYTGVEADSTIYRYVGLAHSYYMNYYNFSLEEYVDKIRNAGIVEFESTLASDKGAAYVVYYVPKSTSSNTTYVPVPTGGEYQYQVSGDGKNGFIVTVKIS